MKIRILILMLTVAGSGLLYQCSDDSLVIVNQNDLNSANFYSNIQNFDLALNGVYDAVKNLDLFGQTFYVQTLLAMPHESDYWNAQNINSVTSSDGNVYIAWRALYRIVARANDIIQNSDKFIATYHPNDND